MDANDKTKLGSGWWETIAYLILLTSSLKETVHQHNDDDPHGLAERNFQSHRERKTSTNQFFARLPLLSIPFWENLIWLDWLFVIFSNKNPTSKNPEQKKKCIPDGPTETRVSLVFRTTSSAKQVYTTRENPNGVDGTIAWLKSFLKRRPMNWIQ